MEPDKNEDPELAQSPFFRDPIPVVDHAAKAVRSNPVAPEQCSAQ